MAATLPTLAGMTLDAVVRWAGAFVSAVEQRFQDLEGRRDPPLRAYVKANLPDASKGAYRLILVTDDTGGAVPAFNDGTNWRRVTDRNVIS